jgi:hypothetical protein
MTALPTPLARARGSWSELDQRRTEQPARARGAAFRPIAQLLEHGDNLGFAKAEILQAGENFGDHVQGLGVLDVSVGSTIGMSEANGRCGLAVDDEVAAMHGAVVSTTDGHDIFDIVAPAGGARLNVVQVEKRGVHTARDTTAMLVAVQDRAAYRGRDRLRRASSHVGAWFACVRGGR